MDVVSLLESKNRCLSRFLQISEEFLLAADQGDFSSLELFHQRRDQALKTIELYDRKIALVTERVPTPKERAAAAEQIRKILEIRDDIVREILNTDERISARIEQEKTRITQELASSRQNQSKIGKFRSQWISESGEELDKKL